MVKTYLRRVGEKNIALQTVWRRAILGLLVEGIVVRARCRVQTLASL